MDSISSIAISQQNANMGAPFKNKKRGRPMGSGNRARNRAKGLHLPELACEMLDQLTIVKGGTESHWTMEGINRVFDEVKIKWNQVHGADSWSRILESRNHIDIIQNPRKRFKD